MPAMPNIFDEAVHALEREGRQVAADVARHFGHAHYHTGSVPENLPEGTAMSVLADFKTDLEKFASDIKADTQSGYNHANDFLQQKLPAVADFLSKAAANPAVDAILGAAHVSPTFLQAVADLVSKADADAASLLASIPQPEPAEATPVAAGDAGTAADAQPAA